MRAGVTFEVSAADRVRLNAIVSAGSSPQKHVWRAKIILMTDAGLGTVAIMEATAKSKTCVWRWQERFMTEGVDGLLRDKSRPPGTAPLEVDLVDRVVALTQEPPTQEATHWTVRAMAKAVGIAASSVVKIWHEHGLAPHRWRSFKLSNDKVSPRSFTMWSVSTSRRLPMRLSFPSMRKVRSRRWIGRSRVFP